MAITFGTLTQKSYQATMGSSLVNGSIRHSTLIDWLLIAGLALGSTAMLAALNLGSSNERLGVAVIFPPWVSRADAVGRAAAAGARLMRLGRFPFVVVMLPTSDKYSDHVLKAGAIAVLDPGSSVGCVFRTAAHE